MRFFVLLLVAAAHGLMKIPDFWKDSVHIHPPQQADADQGVDQVLRKFIVHRMVLNGGIEDETVQPVDVLIREHHNQVLGDWVEKANSNKIRRKNMSVLHFDSHADLNFPALSVSHGWPTSPESAVLSTNIASFIMAAVEIGLVSHVVWIRKDWPETAWNHPQQIGSWRIFVGRDPFLKLCFFPNLLVELDTPTCGPNAVPAFDFVLTTAVFSPSIISDLDERYRSNPHLAVPEDWKDHAILDIDLDFFSTHSAPSTHFRENYQVKRSKFTEISTAARAVSEASCPSDGEKVAEIHQTLARIITEPVVETADEIDKILDHFSSEFSCDTQDDLSRYLGQQKIDTENSAKLKKHFIALVDGSRSLEMWQRWALANFIVEKSPGHKLDLLYSFRAEPSHFATKAELKADFKDFQVLIKNENFSPVLVTVSRSVVDGYTPVNAWPLIEWGVIAVLQSSVGKIRIKWDDTCAPAPQPVDCSPKSTIKCIELLQ